MSGPEVLVAMSGGVDSSTAALLLKESGFQVHGVFLQLWEAQEESLPALTRYAWTRTLSDVQNVARYLEIPLHVLNLAACFRKKVIDRFVAEYLAGRTPNPCVLCNKEIKFQALCHMADQMGIEYVATGHYAKISKPPENQPPMLMSAKYLKKDQSYFLCLLTREQLCRIIFPLAEMSKGQTRALARQKGLPVADKPASQDICFIPYENYGDYIAALTKNQDPKPGEIVDEQGKILGRHRGIYRYTRGQRKGLGIALGHPMYVIDIDHHRNRIVVGPQESAFSTTMIVSQINWLSSDRAEDLQGLKVKYRYNMPMQEAHLEMLSPNRVLVHFRRPQMGIAPGQAAVFYSGLQVIGGGWIEACKR